ncbi:MAG: DUF262 domain-containing HNH endonuclease family protein [Pseudomonadota bacterium]|nr:DUF262 domain-containing HNH endonuclease family protein [Pseudomonadota bacterium]
MKADAVPLLAIFEKKMRLEVPLFQRQYVWSKDQQWEPLWEDISRKFAEYLEGRKDAPVHFLGAMVLDQKQTPTTHVERRQVIDGQQRLTTLQIFIASFRDFCRAQECEELAKECDAFTLNKGMMADPAIDKFKVWPTQLDRGQFMDVISSGSRIELEKKHPLVFRRYARRPELRPRMVEAYLFFYEQIADFFNGGGSDEPLAAEVPVGERLEECFQALKNALQVVAIDLDHDDDAQVIFETLNARGEPLLPADLLRNFIFLRAARKGEPQETLYNDYWRRFDDQFWRVEVKQGRLLRPRSDLFMQHFLSSRQGVDIPIKHLFVEYKFWIERQQPFATVTDELATLSRQRDDFRRIIEPKAGDPICSLAVFLDTFDVRTCYPLLLAMLDVGIDDEEWRKVSSTLESYILRRAVCGLTTKNYNRTFLSLTRNLRRDGLTHANLVKQLSEQTGESAEWPTDASLGEAWRSKNVYQTLNNPKVVHILKRLNTTFIGNKNELVSIDGALTVEHILPQSWAEHWPLPDGSKGLTGVELWTAEPQDAKTVATRRRNEVLQTFGNLTIIMQALNSAASNSAWPEKKVELLRHSLLPINQQLHNLDAWDEETISDRANVLLKRALELWPRT